MIVLPDFFSITRQLFREDIKAGTGKTAEDVNKKIVTMKLRKIFIFKQALSYCSGGVQPVGCLSMKCFTALKCSALYFEK